MINKFNEGDKGPHTNCSCTEFQYGVHIKLDFLPSNLHSGNYLQVQVQFEANEFIPSSKRV